jgi:glycosyltransferase involved in cell wall biosynthesis
MKLSVIIITKNEERDLPACLESVKGVADEIVLVDNHSTDRTLDIARGFGARVFDHEWRGYGPQKQFALEQATGDWALNLDADERLTPASADEIHSLKGGNIDANGFWLPFHVYFNGKRLRFGGCFSERHIRLFRRDKARYGASAVHEGIAVEEPLGRLRGAVRHESYRNFSEYLAKCNEYTEILARKKHERGARFRWWHHLRLPWEFMARYVFKGGFLDGNAGLTYAALSAYYAWLKHARLMDFERGGK